MNDIIIWIIIIGFYAPLHCGLPALVVFLRESGNSDGMKSEIKKVLLDSLLSLVIAFTLAIILVQYEAMTWAMFCLLLSMPYPVLRYLLK